MHRFLFLILCVLPLIACDKAPKIGPPTDNELASAAEESCGYVQNSYGQRVSWKGALPIPIVIDVSFPTAHEPILFAAAKQWEDAAGKTLFQFSRSPIHETNSISWLTSWDSEQRNLQAVTSLRWYRNTLIDARIKIDAEYYNFYTNTPNSDADVHLQSLLIHELGHVLGLKHKTVSPTVMWATLRGKTVREELSATDIQSLKCEY